MRIQYLGTGASEGIPAVFCRCPVCEEARKKAGKEIRLRTGVMIDGKLLVDFSPDTFAQTLRFGYDYTALDALLLTHTHCDHFALDELIQRNAFNSQNRINDVLHVYGNEEVRRRLSEAVCCEDAKHSLSVTVMKNLQTVRVRDYTVTAFQTVHMETEESLVYLVSSGEKHYLHAFDSAELSDSVYEYLREHAIKLNAVSLDCTFGLLKEEYFGHMNFAQNRRVRARLEEIGAADESTRFVLTHISHFAGSTHRALGEAVAPHGFEVAYDGLEITL